MWPARRDPSRRQRELGVSTSSRAQCSSNTTARHSTGNHTRLTHSATASRARGTEQTARRQWQEPGVSGLSSQQHRTHSVSREAAPSLALMRRSSAESHCPLAARRCAAAGQWGEAAQLCGLDEAERRARRGAAQAEGSDRPPQHTTACHATYQRSLQRTNAARLSCRGDTWLSAAAVGVRAGHRLRPTGCRRCHLIALGSTNKLTRVLPRASPPARRAAPNTGPPSYGPGTNRFCTPLTAGYGLGLARASLIDP